MCRINLDVYYGPRGEKKRTQEMKRVRKITYLNSQLNLMIVRNILVAVERNKPRRSKGRTSQISGTKNKSG